MGQIVATNNNGEVKKKEFTSYQDLAKDLDALAVLVQDGKVQPEQVTAVWAGINLSLANHMKF